MKKKDLLTLLRSATVNDLKELLVLKKDLDVLESKQKQLLKQFTTVSKDLSSIRTSYAKPSRKRKPARARKVAKKAAKKKVKKAAKKKVKKVAKKKVKKVARKPAKKPARRKRVVQPSLSSLIVEILSEKKKPLKVNDICEALLKEKKYKTKAKNFKANVRILLYKNEKRLFKKAGPGLFRLAASKKK